MTGVSPEVQAVETIGGVISDLVTVTERLPVQPDQAEPVARILDRLAEEIGEAARMFRVMSEPSRLAAAPGRPGDRTTG